MTRFDRDRDTVQKMMLDSRHDMHNNNNNNDNNNNNGNSNNDDNSNNNNNNNNNSDNDKIETVVNMMITLKQEVLR